MTPAEFDSVVARTGANPESRTMKAARMVMVDGITRHLAARRVGILPPGVYRAVRKLQLAATQPRCPTCGQTLKAA